jgi:predicted DNA-binding transcriptional regulator AlpA
MNKSAGGKFSDSAAYPPRGMELERAAAYVGFGRTKFLEMVEEGKMPKPVDFDGSPRWDRLDLDAAFDDWKARRRDPVKRDRDKLRELFPK